MIARRNRVGLLGTCVLGVSALVVTVPAQPASAQMGGFGGGWAEIARPDFSRRDIVLMVDGLHLDETQRLILETLYDSYEEDFRAKADEFRERMDAMRDDMRPNEEREAVMRATREKFEAMREGMRAKREALEAEYNGEIPEEVEEKFREEVRATVDAMRNEMREQGRQWFQDATAQDMFGKLAPISEEWLRAKNHLRDQFIGDLNAQLTEDQAALWPSVDRLLRRTKSLERGRISGENADLFQIVRSLNLSTEQMEKLTPILNQYEIELDAALRKRDAYLDESRAEMLRAMQTMNSDDGIAIVEKQMKLRAEVRDVNDRYALSIQQELESPLAEKFRDEHRSRAYARVFEPTRMQRVFAAAAKLENLDPSVAEAIATMKTAYEQEIVAKNEALLEAVRKYEPEDAVRMSRRMAARFSGQQVADEPNPLEDAMEERAQIGERYRDQLTALLTEEQVALLPLRRDDDERGRWGGGEWRGAGQNGEWRGRRGGDDDDNNADRPRRRDRNRGNRQGGNNEPAAN